MNDKDIFKHMKIGNIGELARMSKDEMQKKVSDALEHVDKEKFEQMMSNVDMQKFKEKLGNIDSQTMSKLIDNIKSSDGSSMMDRIRKVMKGKGE